MNKLKSRKFWMTVAAEVIALCTGLGLSINHEIIVGVCTIIPIIYVIVEGVIDAVSAKGR